MKKSCKGTMRRLETAKHGDTVGEDLVIVSREFLLDWEQFTHIDMKLQGYARDMKLWKSSDT